MPLLGRRYSCVMAVTLVEAMVKLIVNKMSNIKSGNSVEMDSRQQNRSSKRSNHLAFGAALLFFGLLTLLVNLGAGFS